MAGPLLKDALWSRQSFIVSSKDLAAVDKQNRFYSDADNGFTDTTPGGALVINPPPQFTRFADIKAKSVYSKSKKEGIFYREMIANNNQILNIRFGVPAYNSLSTFFSGFYNSAAGTLARTGRATSIFYNLGRAAGMIVGVIFWPVLAVSWIGQAIKYALQKPSSKYYYLKPTMPLYWNAAQTMLNHIAVNRGIVPRIGGEDNANRLGGPYDFDQDALNALQKKMPEIFNGNGTIDLYAIATRAQRLATKRYKAMQEKLDNAKSADIGKVIQGIQDDKSMTNPETTFEKYRNLWLNSQTSKPGGTGGKNDAGNENADNSAAANAGFAEFLEAEINDGGAFVSFRVNPTGAVDDSFSSGTGVSEISSKINSAAAAGRNTQFNFAGGNIIGGAVGSVLGAIGTAVKDTVAGVADSLSISGLAALSGAAFVDIPEHWQSSVANLPHTSYTMTLGGPYGNPISQLINIYMPLCMLLAGALPLSAGRQSFTSPFICEYFDQGRAQSRLSIIDSISIRRGTSNLAFNADGNFLQVEVTISFKDLSTVVHMPISEGFSMSAMSTGIDVGTAVGAVAGTVTGGPAGTAIGAGAGAAVGGAVGAGVDAAAAVGTAISSFFDDDTVFTDYMAVLGSQGLADQVYTFRRLKLNLTRQMTNLKSFFSAAHYASFVGDTMPGRMVSAIYKGTER